MATNEIHLRGDADRIIAAALAASMPDQAVQAALDGRRFSSGRLLMVAVGKAGWQMAKAACDALDETLDTGYRHYQIPA